MTELIVAKLVKFIIDTFSQVEMMKPEHILNVNLSVRKVFLIGIMSRIDVGIYLVKIMVQIIISILTIIMEVNTLNIVSLVELRD